MTKVKATKCKIFSSSEVKDRDVEKAVNDWLEENKGKILLTHSPNQSQSSNTIEMTSSHHLKMGVSV